MAGRIPDAFIDEINRRADLVGIVRDRVDLKKAGGSWTGRCPFHDEKTPSFHVYETGDFPHYHCYGCEAHGNTLSFLTSIDNLDFVSAVENLAGRLGLEVPREQQDRERYDELKSSYSAASLATELYQAELQRGASLATNYLQERGVDQRMQALYGIGYAPSAGKLLAQASATEKLRPALHSLGLLRGDTNAAYDQFRNRLIFPIRDHRGRTIGFGGRTLGDDKAKYINSVESELFKKSQVVYGLWESKQHFGKVERLVVVEGYLDVIALTQHGIPGAVATMGTATNEDSLQRLLTLSEEVVFCFDGDNAGVSAAKKAMEKILPLLHDGQRVAFMLLPEGEDPDTHVRRIGGEAMAEALDEALPLSLFLFRVLGQNLDLSLAESKSLLYKRGTEMLNLINRQTAPTLHNSLREDLWKATRDQHGYQGAGGKSAYKGRGNGGGGNSGHGGGGYDRFKRRPQAPTLSFSQLMEGSRTNRATPMARSLVSCLLQDPACAARAGTMADFDVEEAAERDALGFAQWLRDMEIGSTADLLYALGCNPDLAERLHYLFDLPALDTGSSLPEGSMLEQQLQDTLAQMKRSYTRSTLLRVEQAMRLDPADAELKAQYKRLIAEL
ncbi:DNA primase [Allohahella marinimesophila]|uniref:DNA primase n=1 Tax=Allohahella marinimesophila TaxID=1054972 RepID=A0ABP7P5N7_9GAMM